MKAQSSERRKRNRTEKAPPIELDLQYALSSGRAALVKVRLIDLHDDGCGVESQQALEIGTKVWLRGNWTADRRAKETEVEGLVVWCRLRTLKSYRLGVAFSHPWRPADSANDDRGASVELNDYYETLQLSTNADAETIHRVYRILAQRYHPDNVETGNDAMFRGILTAYQTLSDPEKRAAYDVQHQKANRSRWKIFDQTSAVHGASAEKRKRQGILALLYTKRMNSPEQSGMTAGEMESLLGVPREHLEFALWFLREAGNIQRTDNGRYLITVKGVEAAESSDLFPVTVQSDRLLEAR
jgi:DnaJ-domain-containing protein 1